MGQIMLQENAFSGLLLLLGICYGSIYMGIGALMAAFIGTITAYILNYNREETSKGLYGFSAALVGAAVFVFLKPALICWLIVLLGASCATLLQHFFIRKQIAAFTFPFVWITWLFYFGVKNFAPDLLLQSSILLSTETDKYLFPFKAFGQVIFQDNLLSGILFFFAVIVNSRISALYGLVGALLSGLIAYGFGLPPAAILNGLFSYNAVLCAIVFADKKKMNWAFVAIILALTIQWIMLQYQLMVLTFPFVCASLITLLLQRQMERKSENN